MPKGNFAILSMWWADTNQHRYGLGAYLTMRSQRGDSLNDLVSDLEDRFTSDDVSIDRSTIGRWLQQLTAGSTPTN